MGWKVRGAGPALQLPAAVAAVRGLSTSTALVLLQCCQEGTCIEDMEGLWGGEGGGRRRTRVREGCSIQMGVLVDAGMAPYYSLTR